MTNDLRLKTLQFRSDRSQDKMPLGAVRYRIGVDAAGVVEIVVVFHSAASISQVHEKPFLPETYTTRKAQAAAVVDVVLIR